MAHEFDRRYWDRVWSGAADAGNAGNAGDAGRASAMATSPPNPHLVREIAGLSPGTALEAGCGAGAEALWLASRGWRVTGVDIAAGALEVAARRAAAAGLVDRVSWLEADLSVWQPDGRFDLVTTHYAHPSVPQLDFYERLAGWVAPGGTLFIVGHLHHGGHGRHGAHPPAEASATAAGITAVLGQDRWEIATALQGSREMAGRGGAAVTVHDVVVRATRRS
ncbi:class I SAM-dependent methyltransferase [Dietzia lutea]|uniref:SAM-dependent methyltransferase n=2 Tax=Dietzia lutea TaxID=546160 RepID=A0A2S1RBZ3_9ACTN|nr:class I SAM-dependent methyltransferase [Dietzia lutea]AWH93808.1 SAM-dependent methyltransferase [Dietzia lutea]